MLPDLVADTAYDIGVGANNIRFMVVDLLVAAVFSLEIGTPVDFSATELAK